MSPANFLSPLKVYLVECGVWLVDQRRLNFTRLAPHQLLHICASFPRQIEIWYLRHNFYKNNLIPYLSNDTLKQLHQEGIS